MREQKQNSVLLATPRRVFLFAQRNRAWSRERRTDAADSALRVDRAAAQRLWIARRRKLAPAL
jgi:hypothetical protein